MSFFSLALDIKLTLGLIISIIVFALGLSLNGSAETSEKSKADKDQVIVSPEKKEPDYKTSSISQDSSGYKVFIDPKTGKFVETPPETEEDISVTRGVNPLNVSEELVEEPAPGGGVMIVLPESHYYFSTATVYKNGKLSRDCSKHNRAQHTDD